MNISAASARLNHYSYQSYNRRDERRGDNYDNDNVAGGQFRSLRGLEYVKLQMPSLTGSRSADDYLD